MAFTIHDIPTPCVLIDRPRAQANITRMQKLATTHGRRLRPHAKTHKLPAIAKMQVEAGATGICCAKLGEAEVFAAGRDQGHPAAVSRPPVESRARRRAPRQGDALDHRRSPAHRARMVGGHDRRRPRAARAGEGGRRLPPLRRQSRFTGGARPDRGGLDAARPEAARAAEPRGPCVSRRERRRAAAGRARRGGDHDGPRRTRAGARRGDWRDQRGRDAAGPVQHGGAGHHRAAAGQLRLQRPHAGGARRGAARRLRADRARHGGEQAGRRSHRPGQRHEDAQLRRRPRLRIARRPGRDLHARSTRSSSTPICSSSGCRRSTPPFASPPARPSSNPATASASSPITPASSPTWSTRSTSRTAATRSSKRCASPPGGRSSRAR